MNAILVNGDHNAHGITYQDYSELHKLNQNGNTKEFDKRMNSIKKNWIKLYELIEKVAEHTIPVLPTFGNNDMVVHS